VARGLVNGSAEQGGREGHLDQEVEDRWIANKYSTVRMAYFGAGRRDESLGLFVGVCGKRVDKSRGARGNMWQRLWAQYDGSNV